MIHTPMRNIYMHVQCRPISMSSAVSASGRSLELFMEICGFVESSVGLQRHVMPAAAI